MNKVITINLNGIAYQLEESGYDALREYLDNAARRLGRNPDKDEIIADIEQAIGDKFRAMLGAHKTVVVTKEVLAVIDEMGPVQDAGAEEHPNGDEDKAAAGEPAPENTGNEPPPPRRLYRIQEGAMFSGVCNGLAAYFGIDVTFVRIAFVILTLIWGAGFLIYLVMSFIVPMAWTPAEKAAATGSAATAQEFIRRAKAGYYEGMKTFHDKQARREWRRKFKQEMRGWSYNFQRTMHENAQQWQQNWSQPPGRPPHFPFAALFVAPILSLVLLALVCAFLYSLFTLVTAGHVFWLTLPGSVPLWVAIVALVVVFHFVSWPVKAARHGCYYRGPWAYGCYSHGPFAGLFWLGVLAICVWYANSHSPEFHNWLQTVPEMLRQAANSVRDWWNGH